MMFVFALFSFTILDSFWITLGGEMLLKCNKLHSELMSPFFGSIVVFYGFGFTFEPGSEAFRHFSESFAYVFF